MSNEAVNPMKKFIINAPLDELPYVLELIQEAIPTFLRSGGRVGWGWHFSQRDRPTYFIREIKGGLSAWRAQKGPDHVQ